MRRTSIHLGAIPMDEKPDNPYDSALSSFQLEKPPIERLGWIAYIVLSFAVVLIGFVAFWICFVALCFGGFLFADATQGVLPDAVGLAMVCVAASMPFIVMLLVVRWLSNKWIRRRGGR